MALESRFPLHRNAGFQLPELRCKTDRNTQQFYDSLHLGYETRRLDYLGLQLEGKYQSEKDEKRKIKLGESLSILLKKRNRMTVTGRSL